MGAERESMRGHLRVVRRARPWAVTALCLLAAGACREVLAPTPPSGVFELRTMAAQPIPVVLYEGTWGQVLLEADTVVIGPDQHGTRVRWQRNVASDGTVAPASYRRESSIEVTVRHGELRVSEGVVCLAGGVGESCADLWDLGATLSGSTLQIGTRVYALLSAAP